MGNKRHVIFLVFLLSLTSFNSYSLEVTSRPDLYDQKLELIKDTKTINGDVVDVLNIDIPELFSKKTRSGSRITALFNGKYIQLKLYKIVVEEGFNVIHWVGHVSGDKSSYVRFTVLESSLFSSKPSSNINPVISGYIKNGDEEDFIRYSPEISASVVYKNKKANNSIHSEEHVQSLLIESLGIRYDVLEKNKLKHSIGLSGTLTVLEGSPVETVIYGRGDLELVIEMLRDLIPLVGSEEVIFSRILNYGDSILYDYTEIIDGKPVLGSSLRISVDKTTRKITGVLTNFVSDLSPHSAPGISDRDAFETALLYIKKYDQDFQIGNISESLFSSELVYKIKNTKSGDARDLDLHWRITIGDQLDNISILVNAMTGRVNFPIKVLE